MVEVKVLIPLTSNGGETFSPEHHAAFEAFVLDRFGGLSKLPGEVSGQWVDGGTVYVDRLIAYVLAVGGIVSESGKLAEVVAFAKIHYGQLSLYVSYLGTSETL